MIEFEETISGKRLYMYNNKKYTLTPLSKLNECVVSRPTLAGRLCNAIRFDDKRTKWKTVRQCLITPISVGRPAGGKLKPKPNIIKELIDNDEFLKIMKLMPIGSLSDEALIIQSKKIG